MGTAIGEAYAGRIFFIPVKINEYIGLENRFSGVVIYAVDLAVAAA